MTKRYRLYPSSISGLPFVDELLRVESLHPSDSQAGWMIFFPFGDLYLS